MLSDYYHGEYRYFRSVCFFDTADIVPFPHPQAVPPREQNSEWLTRKCLIDPKLNSACWEMVPFSTLKSFNSNRCCAIAEFETANGPADYALCVNGKILGVVEAKKLTLGPQSVLMQAERYAKGLIEGAFNFGGYRVPFLYSTNGEVIWFHDIRNALNRSHTIAQFHTPEALSERLSKDFDAACQNLLHTPNDHPRESAAHRNFQTPREPWSRSAVYPDQPLLKTLLGSMGVHSLNNLGLSLKVSVIW
jgi:type I site-specific restriction endonuclease